MFKWCQHRTRASGGMVLELLERGTDSGSLKVKKMMKLRMIWREIDSFGQILKIPKSAKRSEKKSCAPWKFVKMPPPTVPSTLKAHTPIRHLGLATNSLSLAVPFDFSAEYFSFSAHLNKKRQKEAKTKKSSNEWVKIIKKQVQEDQPWRLVTTGFQPISSSAVIGSWAL